MSKIAKYFPYFIYSYYNKHFYNNIKISYRKIVTQKLQDYTCAKFKSIFDKFLEKIKKIDKDAI